LFPDARKVQLQLSAITSAPTLALPINSTDICELQSNIFTMLGAVSSPKPCVGKNKPLIVLCNSSNTVFGFSVFDAVNPNTVFDLQTPTSSHFDEGSFAVFVSRCAVKCSGCLMGQYTHRQFKLQLLNIPQPA
tara:strand:+ start:387 stop:785 length:399 start_codon:yes stop_codon:yes gene_type:complete